MSAVFIKYVEFIKQGTNLFCKKGSELKKQFPPQNSKAKAGKKGKGWGEGKFLPAFAFRPAYGGLVRLGRTYSPPACAEASAGKLFQAKIIFRIPTTGCAAEFLSRLTRSPVRARDKGTPFLFDQMLIISYTNC